MKTAVPGTRVGGVAAIAETKSSSGNARAVSRSATRRRPVFHVVIAVKSSSAMNRLTQPPCGSFSRLAPKKETSIAAKRAVTL